MTEGSLAPDLVGLHPDDAARRGFEPGLKLDIENPGIAAHNGTAGTFKTTDVAARS